MNITLHFHPDWPHGDGLLAPTQGSDRWKWESRLFGGRYDEGTPADRPVYGSWTRRSDAYGGSPRFGSAYYRLRPEVAGRATYCYPDSTGNHDPQTVKWVWHLLARYGRASSGGAVAAHGHG